jgi:lysophospholipase L1-like esterase
MQATRYRLMLLLLAAALAVRAEPVPEARVAVGNQVRGDAAAPAPQATPRFQELHAAYLARAKAGPIGVLFLGDSITYGWNKVPALWEKYYGAHQPANFGVGADQTQHLLWRIEHGELDGISPQLVVLLIGTNNTAVNTAEEIFAAQTKIIGLIRTKLPAAKVLVLAVFPRGPRSLGKDGVPRDDGVTRMKVIDAVNARLASLDDGRNIRVLNVNRVFLGADGRIPDALMPDQLHPNEEGYRRWAEAMQPLFVEMIK